MPKKRILCCGEATFLETGYGKYSREVLSRLYNTGKYEIAEFASYGHYSDPRRHNIPWTYYGNAPDEHDPEQMQHYHSNPTNEFGEWRFEEVLLDFRPDIVWDVRDWWMFEYEERSPLRRHYHWVVMPTVDSAPQLEQWLNTYLNADAVFTYSEFGKEVLENESNGQIKVVNTCPPGADLDIFKPVKDKKAHRDLMGLTPDINIVGTVMRNQKRKLYPDLIQGFKTFLEKNPDLGRDTYLYLHTSYPDIGWDIPLLVKESGISHKILFTYYCRNCRQCFPAFFQDAVMACIHCGLPTAKLPNHQRALDESQLASILNLFDVYVQYSICEGFGMPQVEAGACGIPVMAVNYSAMESVVKNLKGYPIEVQRLFREAETHAYRAYPNNDDLADKIAEFLSLPKTLRMVKGRDSYSGVRRHYTWDLTAKKWEQYFDSVDVSNNVPWDAPPRIMEPSPVAPRGLTNEQFVEWSILNVWGEPSKLNSYQAVKMIKDLNYGQAIEGTGGFYYNEASYLNEKVRYRDFDQSIALDKLYQLAQLRNYWERRRVGVIEEATPDFVFNAKPSRQ